jgi:hypothetical protein
VVEEVSSGERGEEVFWRGEGGLEELGMLALEELGWGERGTNKEGVHWWDLDQKLMGGDWEQELRERGENQEGLEGPAV